MRKNHEIHDLPRFPLSSFKMTVEEPPEEADRSPQCKPAVSLQYLYFNERSTAWPMAFF